VVLIPMRSVSLRATSLLPLRLGWLRTPDFAMSSGEKLWGGRFRSWHLHRPYELMEVASWPKSMISAEA
jgi:hypothetical protein